MIAFSHENHRATGGVGVGVWEADRQDGKGTDPRLTRQLLKAAKMTIETPRGKMPDCQMGRDKAKERKESGYLPLRMSVAPSC
jgi:hypothetical protein